MKAVIFNSGLGSRMGELTKDKPKCMLELYNGETIFQRQIRILSQCGIEDFIITTGPYKEQLVNLTKKYDRLKFTFVENPDYQNTNYIVSMNNANEFLNDDVLLMHGDLVFNRGLIEKILSDKRKSLCLFNEERPLPEKDFKGRFSNNILKEVSISIFDRDCYAFQPLYKLSRETIEKWKNEVSAFVHRGDVKVYAENALNCITDRVSIYGFSYRDDYIEEIDNEEDYVKVSNEIKFFDYREQEIIKGPYIKYLKQHIDPSEEIFIVSGKNLIKRISADLEGWHVTCFSDFSPNPQYEEIKRGIDLFRKEKFKKIISFGGGSSIDVAKCIKLFSTLKHETDFLKKKYSYNDIKHIAIPTTAGTGSEATQIAVMYYNGEKFSVDHGSILPDTTVLDYTLLKTLPDNQRKSTLLDALCQAIESFWSKGATEESRKYSEKCIMLILENYKGYLENNDRCLENILEAADYSGKAINISRTTAPHAMSYKLTSLYGISHGYAVVLCLIPCWKMLCHKSESDGNLNKILSRLAGIIGYDDIPKSIEKIEEIMNEMEIPKVNLQDHQIDNLAETINTERMKNNPVIFNKKEIRQLYSNLYCDKED